MQARKEECDLISAGMWPLRLPWRGAGTQTTSTEPRKPERTRRPEDAGLGTDPWLCAGPAPSPQPPPPAEAPFLMAVAAGWVLTAGGGREGKRPRHPERQEGLKGPKGKGLLGSGQEEGPSGRRWGPQSLQRGPEETLVPLLSAPAPRAPLPPPLTLAPNSCPRPSPGPLFQAFRRGQPSRHRMPDTCS